MDNTVATYKISDSQELRILYDVSPIDPRKNDNRGKMICFHRRYRLGDEHDYKIDDYESWDELKEQIEQDYDVAVILPLFLFDHSGISISTAPSCQWDSGQVGWIFIDMPDEPLAGLFEEILTKIIHAEVEEYDQYLRGDIYGFELLEETTCEPCGAVHKDIIDSCWGFYGHDIKKNGILECLDPDVAEIVKEQL